MAERLLIGVDIGTQGTKAGLFVPDGQCLAAAFCPSRLHRPAPGITEEDPERQFATVAEAVRRCIRQAGVGGDSVCAIGIDGQMAGVLGVGADGRSVTPYDSWLDTRCRPYIELMNRRAGVEVLRKTGCAPSFNHGPKILWWMNERKAAFRRIRAFVQPGGYAAMRLCGLSARDAFIDTTYLHFSGFADNLRSRWDSELCEKFGLDEAKLPRIVQPHEIIGELCAGAARRCGLRAGIPVVAGCGDTAASFLACGAAEEGVCVDVSGTACVFAATTDAFRPDMKYKTLGCGQSATPGLWHPYAYINGGGMNLEWFLREIANAGRGGQRKMNLHQLNRQAEKLAADEPLPLFVPHMEGRVCPGQPHMKGAWVSLSWKHTPAHLYRSMLQSVALEYAIYMKIIRANYPGMKFKTVRVTGGGARSDIWNGIKASVLNLPVTAVAGNQGAPAGAAMVAGVGVGLFDSLSNVARRWVALGRRLRPDRKAAEIYRRRVGQYERLLELVNRFGIEVAASDKGSSK